MKGETKTVLKELGLRMREVRDAQRLTQEQVAEKLGMLHPNYARIEQGRMNVTVDTLVRISKALKVGIGEFFVKPKLKRAPVGRPLKN